MTVYAPHLNRCTVQIDNRVFYLNFSKSDFFPYTFLPTDNFNRIQVWCLRIPKLRIRYIQFTVPTVRLSLRTQSTAGIKYTNIRFLHTACALPGKCNRSAKSIFVRLRHDPIVPDMVFRAGQKIDISENSRHSQFVLIFQIRSVTPFQHQHCQNIFPIYDVFCDIKLAGCMRYLTISHKHTVHPYVKTGIYPLKVQIDCFIRFFIHPKNFFICPAGIFCRNVWRLIRYRIFLIDILMTVNSIILPTGRNLYLCTSFCYFRHIKMFRNLLWRPIKCKLPFSVQQRLTTLSLQIFGNIIGPWIFCPQM